MEWGGTTPAFVSKYRVTNTVLVGAAGSVFIYRGISPLDRVADPEHNASRRGVMLPSIRSIWVAGKDGGTIRQIASIEIASIGCIGLE